MGEMQADKLNHFKEILTYSNPVGINQTTIVGHHPVYEVRSETTSEEKTFQGILAESGAQFVFNGHIHYPNLYVNRGSYTEAECPSFKDRYMYRIAAFDDDIASFSDVYLDQWPQIVVTSPIDARFYNPNMPLERMITHNEIRALLFDNVSITSAYAEIDGKLIGDLINQRQNLWTVSYSPQNYQTGIHYLTIHASSFAWGCSQGTRF